MKYLWFIGAILLFVKGVALLYFSLNGEIEGILTQHIIALIISILFLGYGMYLLYPKKRV